jgi:serine/threonine-protein kinase
VTPWGHIDVDGQPAGATPPLSRLSLAEGAHTITVRNADFPPHTVQVQVSADRPVTIRHRFGS